MYEKGKEPLATRRVFIKRLQTNLAYTLAIITSSLCIGTIGYHFWAKCQWIDAFHNASMILSGMGPVVNISNNAGKLFSSFYALFSGLLFVTNLGILLTPLIHRILHRLHMED